MSALRVGIVGAVLGSAVGIGGTLLLAAGAHSAPPAPAAGERHAAAAAPPSLDRAALRAEVQSAVRAELARAAADTGDSAATAATPDSEPASRPAPDPAREAEHAAALAEATERVDAGLRAGRWTDADVADLRRRAPSLNPEEHHQLLVRLAIAMNSRRLKIDVSGGSWF
jgi:hypothetical protein